MSELKKEIPWVGLLFLIYLCLWTPTASVYHFLSTGDMGRDAYAFEMTLRGRLPCRDYWWQYGPLMPIYYAFWFFLLGINLASIKIGLGFLLFLCGLSSYIVLRLLVPPSIAFIFSLSFLQLDITHTFNHVGSFPLIYASLFSLVKFFMTRNLRWYYGGILICFILSLIKISIGLTTFFSFVISSWLYCKLKIAGLPGNTCLISKQHIFYSIVTFTACVFGGYGLLYYGLPLDRIHQCLTSCVAPDPGAGFFATLDFKGWYQYFSNERRKLLWCLFFGGISILGLYSLLRHWTAVSNKRILIVMAGSSLIFAIVNSFLDFILISPLHFRIAFWIFPMQVVLMGLSTQCIVSFLGRKMTAIFGFGLLAALLIAPLRNLWLAAKFQRLEHFLDLTRGQIYLSGDLSYVQSLHEITDFIVRNSKEDDEILAVPYDPLFCFLSGRRHAIPELYFPQWWNISEARQIEIINKLETNKVPIIIGLDKFLFGNKNEWSLRKVFGLRLSQYIFDNYQERMRYTYVYPKSSEHTYCILQRKGKVV